MWSFASNASQTRRASTHTHTLTANSVRSRVQLFWISTSLNWPWQTITTRKSIRFDINLLYILNIFFPIQISYWQKRPWRISKMHSNHFGIHVLRSQCHCETTQMNRKLKSEVISLYSCKPNQFLFCGLCLFDRLIYFCHSYVSLFGYSILSMRRVCITNMSSSDSKPLLYYMLMKV